MSDSTDKPKDTLTDKWGSASAIYAAKAEHVTGLAAKDLVSWVNSKSSLSATGATAFDNGSGTGVVAAALQTQFPNLPILAADLSPGMLKMVEKKGLSNVRTQVLDAVDLSPIPDDTFTHTLSTFMVQFTPDPHQALRELYRVTKAGGTLGLGMWGELWMHRLWVEACRPYEPGYVYPHQWTPDWSDAKKLQRYIEMAGFRDVQMKTISPRMDFESPEAYCEYFFESKNPHLERAVEPWSEKGQLDLVKSSFERIVRENFNGTNDFNMNVFLFVARK